MKEFKGTKGTWEIDSRSSTNVRSDTRMVATTAVMQFNELTDKENEENAKLIATAPELLESTQSLLALIKGTWALNGWDSSVYDEVQRAESAINKALGE